MSITLKSRQQIAQLRDAGRLVAETFEVLREHITAGVTTAELDRIAEEYIRGQGAEPIYKGYGAMRGRGGQIVRPAFPATICVATNDVICHGIPSPKEKLRNGDIIGVDIGVLLNGWVGDACYTYMIGTPDDKTRRLVETAYRCLELGIAQAQVGDRVLQAHRYGDRALTHDLRQVSIHGIALAGHLAVLDSPIRRMEPGETAEALTETCVVTGGQVVAPNDPATGQTPPPTITTMLVGTHGYELCCPFCAEDFETRMERLERQHMSALQALGAIAADADEPRSLSSSGVSGSADYPG